MTRLTVLLLTAAALAAPSSASAITGGDDTGTAHGNVGMIRFTQPDGRFRCTGTLIGPRLVLTAAHCAQDATQVVVSFDNPGPADPQTDPSTANRYIAGTAHAHPDYTGKLQNNAMKDAGVVVLEKDATTTWPGIRPAALPPLGLLDQLKAKNGFKGALFTLAGYGVFFAKPADGPQKPDEVSDRVRRATTAVFGSLSSDALALKENQNDNKAGGGTCFGDSGGPAFLNGVVVGITSSGASQFCRSQGVYQRTDTEPIQSFVARYR